MFPKLSPENCHKDCPGCGMTFPPNPKICPTEVFSDWEIGRDWEIDDLKQWQVKIFMEQGSENDLYRLATKKLKEQEVVK